MKLTLTNFKCHRSLILDFQDSKITLLKGKSGIGKSTVFEAIKWCLFGKLQRVVPRGEENNHKLNCCVELEVNGMYIKRSKNPEQLHFRKPGSKDLQLKDDIAQSQIDLIFGEYVIWYNCSYSEQDQRNILISGTEKEKIELLNILSFRNENPEIFISKVTEQIKYSKYKLEQLKGETKIVEDGYVKFTVDNNGKFTDKSRLSPEEYTSLEAEITEKEKEIVELEKRKIQNQQDLALRQSLEKNRDEIRGKILELRIVEINTEMVKKLEIQIYGYKKYLEQYEGYIRNKAEIERINRELSMVIILKNPELIYQEISKLSLEINQNVALISELKIKLIKSEKIQYIKNELSKFGEVPDLILLNQELNRLAILEQKHLKNKMNLKQKQDSENELIKVKQELTKHRELSQLHTEVSTLTQYIQYETFYNQNLELGKKITLIQAEINGKESVELSNELFIQFQIQISKYEQNLKLCQNLNIEYQADTILQFKQKLELGLQKIPLIHKKLKILELQSELSKYKTRISETELQKVNEELYRLKEGANLLKCPECNSSLQLIDRVLKRSNLNQSTKEEIAIAEQQYTKMKQNREETIRAETLQKELDLLGEIPNVDQRDLETLDQNIIQNQLNLLTGIEIIPKPVYTLSELETGLRVTGLKKELNLYISQYNPNLQNIDYTMIKSTLQMLTQELELVQGLLSMQKQLEKQISEIEIQNLEEIKVDLNQFREQINQYKLIQIQKEQYTAELMNLGEVETVSKEVIQSLEQTIQSSKTQLTLFEKEFQEQTLKYKYRQDLEQKLSLEQSKVFDLDLTLTAVTSEKLTQLTQEYTVLQKQVETNKINQSLEQSFKLQIQELEIKIGRILINTQIEAELSQLKERLSLIQQKLAEAKIYNTFVEHYFKLKTAKDNTTLVEVRLTNLYQLEQIAKETERYCLDTTVNDLNLKLNTICTEMFEEDDGLMVQINLYKALKNGNLKSSVNIMIEKQGKQFDSSELSSGQKGRISLALSIALSHYCSSPFLLLDECTQVDQEAREKCFKSLKYNTNKTCVTVNHLEVEGQYDDVINLDGGCC